MLYRCASCNYIGPVVIEVDDSNTLKELEKSSKDVEMYSVEKEHIDEREKRPPERLGGVVLNRAKFKNNSYIVWVIRFAIVHSHRYRWY